MGPYILEIIDRDYRLRRVPNWSCFARSCWFCWRDPQQLVWPNHCSHTGKWLPLSPFCTLLHHLCAASGFASCHMTSKRTQGCPWWWHRCHVMITVTVTAKHPVCVRVCDRHNNQTALLFTHPLNVYPSPKFPPVAPWFSPDWNLLSPPSHRPPVSGRPYVMFTQWSHQSLSYANSSYI